MQWTINGRPYHADCDIRISLLDLSREHPGLSGTHKGATMFIGGNRCRCAA